MRWIEKRKKKLFNKWLHHTITPSELRELDMLRHLKDDEILLAFLDQLEKENPTENDFLEYEQDIETNIITRQINNTVVFRKVQRILLSCACIVLLVVIVIAFFRYSSNKQHVEEVFVGKTCSPLMLNTDLPREFFACEIEIKELFQKRLDGKNLGKEFRINNLKLAQKQPGVLYVSQDSGKYLSPSKDQFLTIYTPPKRQFIVVLPDNTTIRLDGGSRLHYLLNEKDTSITYCRLEGQAYVKVNKKKEGQLFVLDNYNSQLLTDEGAYVVRSEIGYSRAIRLSGDVAIATKQSPQAIHLKKKKNMQEVYSFKEGTMSVRDSFVSAHMDSITALSWTQSIRRYNDISLRNFMLEMERWYGFKIESIQCLPKELDISAAVCHDAPMEDVFAVVARKGVTIYQNNGMFTFCPPAGRLQNHKTDVTRQSQTIQMLKLGFIGHVKK